MVRWRRAVGRALVLAILAATGDVAFKLHTANFAVVEPGRVYRSAQMAPDALARALRARGIRTVLNLRGPNADAAWYRAERAATLACGATQVDVPMSSCQWLSRSRLRALIRILDACDYPLLIHCQHGAERTGLVSAFVELLHPDRSPADARGQLALRYLFLPIKDGALMLDHLRAYESWRASRRLAHAPETFRRWVAEGYRPGHPSYEDWPYDPYPLVVVTRPMASGQWPGARGQDGPLTLSPLPADGERGQEAEETSGPLAPVFAGEGRGKGLLPSDPRPLTPGH